MKFAKFTAMNGPVYNPDPTPIGTIVGLAALLFGGGVLAGAVMEHRSNQRRLELERQKEHDEKVKKWTAEIKKMLRKRA